MLVTIRHGDLDDVGFLAEAHRSGHRAVEEERGGRLDILLRGRPEPIEESFVSSLDAAGTTVLIGTTNETAVGYLVLVLDELRSGEVIGRVTDLWVHPEARGIGVGAALMGQASTIAEGNGCTGIDARALPGDRVTKNFFESFGLVARSIEVHKAL